MKRNADTMTNEEMREVMIARKEIFDGRVLHITCDTVSIPGGGTSTREVGWHRGAVCVVPVTDAGEIILVEQFRYPVDDVLLEIPAGKLDYPEEDRLDAARRELAEETGYRAAKIVSMGDYYGSPAILCERITMFLATGLTPGEVNPDEDEFLRLRKLPLPDAAQLVLEGKVPDGKTQAAILRAYVLLKEGRL